MAEKSEGLRAFGLNMAEAMANAGLGPVIQGYGPKEETLGQAPSAQEVRRKRYEDEMWEVAPSAQQEAAATCALGFEDLRRVLDQAFEQSAKGKGQVRHGRGRPFTAQPIMTLGRLTGPAGPAYQVMKKVQEALGMVARGESEAAKVELLGAIIYAAGAVLLIEEAVGGKK